MYCNWTAFCSRHCSVSLHCARSFLWIFCLLYPCMIRGIWSRWREISDILFMCLLSRETGLMISYYDPGVPILQQLKEKKLSLLKSYLEAKLSVLTTCFFLSKKFLADVSHSGQLVSFWDAQ